MSKIIYTQSNGVVAVIHPTGDVDNAIKDVPDGISYEVVEDSAVPSDKTFRNAWVQDSKTIKTDMAKAKEIHQSNIRKSRKSKLEALDVEFQKAQETSANTSTIVSKKQALRDAPADSAINAASDEAALKAQWNTSLLGASPYS
tara:strand:- start:1038 stop:1469 length:432 start_codon:yes stop_codon:yes gene_type:complete